MFPFQTIVKRLSTATFVSLGLAVLVPACAGDTVLEIEDYDQTCQTVDDCESVLIGDMCGCSCDWGALAKSDLEQFYADDEAARNACGDDILTCGACPDPPALACESGKCTLVTP